MIKIFDAMPSTGKTLKIIDFINNNTDRKYLFITPYLTETHRISGVQYKIIKEDVIPLQDSRTKDFIYEDFNPKYNCVASSFKHPIASWKGKLNSLLNFIREDHNVVGTHSLYTMLTQEVYNELKSRGYTLIIDETLDVFEKFDGGLRPKQLKTLWEDGFITREEGTGKIVWREKEKDVKPEDTLAPLIKRLSDNGNLISPEENNPNNIIFWMFPVEFLVCFEDVFILTHNFEGSLMHKYLQKHNTNYGVEKIPRRHNPIDFVNIYYDDKMNAIGDGYFTLSKTNTEEMCKGKNIALKKNLINWFNNINSGYKVSDRSYTTFKNCHPKLRGKGYTKCFLPCNTRATDIYKDRSILAYCCNRFLDRYIKNFLDITQEDEEQWAVNECVQWLYRHSMRQDKECQLYIPSQRMRELLIMSIT